MCVNNYTHRTYIVVSMWDLNNEQISQERQTESRNVNSKKNKKLKIWWIKSKSRTKRWKLKGQRDESLNDLAK